MLPCTPVATSYMPPTSTVFYHSGDATNEGTQAFTVVGSVTSSALQPISSGTSLSFQSGSYLSAAGLPLPSGNTASTISAWVRCPPTVLEASPGALLSWGTPANTIMNTERYGLHVSAGTLPTAAKPARFFCTRFSPVAGSAISGTADDAVGTSAGFTAIKSMKLDSAGNIIVIDDVRIRRVNAATGAVTTITGQVGSTTHLDGTLAQALFKEPRAIAVDSAGIIYVSDGVAGNYPSTDSCRIRKVTTTSVSTLAGGIVGSSDGLGASASFRIILSMAVDNVNSFLYVAEARTIRRVSTINGATVTVAGSTAAYVNPPLDGTGTAASFADIGELVYDGVGALYVTDYNANWIRESLANSYSR